LTKDVESVYAFFARFKIPRCILYRFKKIFGYKILSEFSRFQKHRFISFMHLFKNYGIHGQVHSSVCTNSKH
jgi:hypothetical protein